MQFEDIAQTLDNVVRSINPVSIDSLGFEVFCEEAQIAWLRISYVKKLATRSGPCPRRQEVDPNGIIVGRVPKGKKFVLSHCWAAEAHIDPTGMKLARVFEELQGLRASEEDEDEDALFIDVREPPRPTLRFRAHTLLTLLTVRAQTVLLSSTALQCQHTGAVLQSKWPEALYFAGSHGRGEASLQLCVS